MSARVERTEASQTPEGSRGRNLGLPGSIALTGGGGLLGADAVRRIFVQERERDEAVQVAWEGEFEDLSGREFPVFIRGIEYGIGADGTATAEELTALDRARETLSARTAARKSFDQASRGEFYGILGEEVLGAALFFIGLNYLLKRLERNNSSKK